MPVCATFLMMVRPPCPRPVAGVTKIECPRLDLDEVLAFNCCLHHPICRILLVEQTSAFSRIRELQFLPLIWHPADLPRTPVARRPVGLTQSHSYLSLAQCEHKRRDHVLSSRQVFLRLVLLSHDPSDW